MELHQYPWGEVCCAWMGPKLMHSFATQVDYVKQVLAKSGDALVLCYGEIDARCHLHHYMGETERSFCDPIHDLVDNYLALVLAYTEALKARGVKICIYFVLPAARRLISQENLDYPFAGSDEDRKRYSLCMNNRLREGCLKNDFIFVDLYDAYCDADGFLDPEKSDGHVHIRDAGPLVEFIKKRFV